MLTKRYSSHLDEEETPALDEGWWSSVLADEEAHAVAHKEASTRTSQQPIINMVDWDHVQELYEQDEIIELQVHGYNRGGLLVQSEGVQGFVPISHLVDMPNGASEEERRRIMTAYLGRTLQLKVIECEPSQERVVLSERAALAGEGRRKQLFRSLHNGEIVVGAVTNVTDFGVFVDLGGVEGLIHVSELSWGRVQTPSEVLKVGQEVRAVVLQVSEENARVALSHKRLYPNPWDSLCECYKPGDVVPGVITSIMRFGAFARLNEGVEGLIHISSINMPEDESLEHYLRPGQHVRVRILHIEAERRRLGLGLVAIE
ncbi:MAG TPA: S1 RNA-binding domain-containing protein [Anaerolineaceae bacterium]